MSLPFTLPSVAVAVGVLYALEWRKKNRLSATTWEELVSRLEQVPMNGISKIALDYLQPGKSQHTIETDEMWFLVGGAAGLARMQANAEVLIQLAAFAQQWNAQESILVGERMRRDGLTLRRAVRKVNLSLFIGFGTATGPFSVQEAASAYYLMRQRLLALYETSHDGWYPRISIALGHGIAAYGTAL